MDSLVVLAISLLRASKPTQALLPVPFRPAPFDTSISPKNPSGSNLCPYPSPVCRGSSLRAPHKPHPGCSHLRKRTKSELRQHQQSLEHAKNPYIGQTPWYAAGKSCPERKTQEHSRDFPHLARPHPCAGCEPLGSAGATGAGQGSLPLPPQHKPRSDLLVPHY